MFKVFKTPEFKKAISFFVEGIKENKKSFYISNISALLWCFLVIIQPYLIKRIIDDGIVAEIPVVNHRTVDLVSHAARGLEVDVIGHDEGIHGVAALEVEPAVLVPVVLLEVVAEDVLAQEDAQVLGVGA